MPKRTLYFSLLFLIPMLVSLACICSAPAAIPEPAEEIVVQPTEQVATPMPPQETATETTPASETGVALVLIDQHFWSYDPGRVMVSFLLENPSSQVVFTDVEYSISLYDQDRQIIAQRTEIISFIFQNQTVGILYSIL